MLAAACHSADGANVQAKTEQRQLNVLFIMADDLRPELATFGSPAQTPHLDRLAQRSVQFDRAYCQQAVCNPSRSSLLTGERPDTLHVWNNSTHFREPNPDVTTLPLWFKGHGYTTLCVGKIFHNWHTKEKGDARSWSAAEFLHYANHGDDKPRIGGELPPDRATAPRCERRDVPDEAYYDGRVAAEAVRVLDKLGSDPFFLAVGFWKPHAPFNAPQKYWDLYERDKLPSYDPARPDAAPEIAFHDGRELRGAPPNQITFNPSQAAEIRHGYFANISYLDAQVGKVLDALERRGLAERTLIVFVSDHGYHLGEQDLWGKSSNFELDARVPLFVASPQCKHAGSRSQSLVELIDLFPTLVELCGLPMPQGLDGKSFARLLDDPTAPFKPAAYTEYPRPAYYQYDGEQPQAMGCSVRTPLVRYTEWRDWKTGQVKDAELYDFRTGGVESKNVIAAPPDAATYQEAVRLLHAQFPAGMSWAQR